MEMYDETIESRLTAECFVSVWFRENEGTSVAFKILSLEQVRQERQSEVPPCLRASVVERLVCVVLRLMNSSYVLTQIGW